jgi:transcriptional regulator with XRE-family HTH domain
MIKDERKEKRKKLKKKISKKIAKLRKILGKEAFQTVDLRLTHPGFIGRIERGEVGPSLELIYGLAVCFNVNINWIIAGEKPIFLNKGISDEVEERLDEIGKRVKKIRLFLALNTNEIGPKCMTDAPAISRIENGKSTPPLDFFYHIYLNYNVNLNWLFTGEGPMFLKKK